MSPCNYYHQFHLALSTLNHLEQFWEPPIATKEACTIFLHSFPHHMILMFQNFLDILFTPEDLTLDNICNGMENILSINPRKQPRQIAIGLGPPRSIPTPDPLDYRSDEQEPLLPIGPLSCNGHQLDPIYLGGIPACLASSLTNPDTFTLDLSNYNHDGTVHA